MESGSFHCSPSWTTPRPMTIQHARIVRQSQPQICGRAFLPTRNFDGYLVLEYNEVELIPLQIHFSICKFPLLGLLRCLTPLFFTRFSVRYYCKNCIQEQNSCSCSSGNSTLHCSFSRSAMPSRINTLWKNWFILRSYLMLYQGSTGMKSVLLLSKSFAASLCVSKMSQKSTS